MASRQQPARLSPAERVRGFAEVEKVYLPHQAMAEAARCLFCHDAPCIKGCPAGVDVPNFIRKIKTRNLPGAMRVIRQSNVLGGSCARACPAAELCEKRCAGAGLSEPIAISALQRFVMDIEMEKGIRLAGKGPDTGKKVAVIGSGPAGLAAAYELNVLGHTVTVFEARPLAGGVMTYGIPPYRLPYRVVKKEIEAIEKAGVRIVTNTRVGRDVCVESILKEFDAVFIGSGLGNPAKLGIPGEDLEGVFPAEEFLAQVNLAELGEPMSIHAGRLVAVLGGGNTAMDAACSAKRLGAERVMVIYRRSAEEMPALREEYEFAREEGVEFLWHTGPVEILGDGGRVKGIRCVRMQPGEPDPSGRRRPIPVEGSEFDIEVDTVLEAVGRRGSEEIARMFGLETDPHGNLVVDPMTGRTSHPRVFAGGDVANGGKTVVQAVGEGKRAAQGIHALLCPASFKKE